MRERKRGWRAAFALRNENDGGIRASYHKVNLPAPTGSSRPGLAIPSQMPRNAGEASGPPVLQTPGNADAARVSRVRDDETIRKVTGWEASPSV